MMFMELSWDKTEEEKARKLFQCQSPHLTAGQPGDLLSQKMFRLWSSKNPQGVTQCIEHEPTYMPLLCMAVIFSYLL